MKVTGTVSKKKVAAGSKSEHAAVTMVVDGKTYILRQRRKNAFQNEELENLVGKKVLIEGDVAANVLFVRSYTILD